MQQWEYVDVRASTRNPGGFIDEINGLGEFGWELVGIMATNPRFGWNTYTAVLKRPVQEATDT